MANLRDVVAYLCFHYPHKEELSKARLTKMVYLADWKSALSRGRQITEIVWQFNHYGPYVPDVIETVQKDPLFEIVSTVNFHGQPKTLINLRVQPDFSSLQEEDKEILTFVIKKSSPKFWDDFIRLVYSTYPILTRSRYSSLDLVALANEYKQKRDLLTEESPGEGRLVCGTA